MNIEYESSITRVMSRSLKILSLGMRTLVTLEEVYWALKILVRKDYCLMPVPFARISDLSETLRD